MFSEDCTGETKLVDKSDNFDLIRLRNNVARWFVQKTEFDFGDTPGDTPTDASRLTVTFDVVSGSRGIHGNLKASGINCLRLAEVLRAFIIPGLK